MSLVLRPPVASDEAAARAIHEQLLADGFQFIFGDGPWDEVLATVARESAGVDLTPDRVRADYLLADVDGDVVGRVSIRYALNDFLYRIGGHVGYAVAPQFRRRGYATEILRQAVAKLNDAGVDRVLVTCDDDNIASAKTIEACGGVLENLAEVPGESPKRRYWIG